MVEDALALLANTVAGASSIDDAAAAVGERAAGGAGSPALSPYTDDWAFDGRGGGGEGGGPEAGYDDDDDDASSVATADIVQDMMFDAAVSAGRVCRGAPRE